MYPPKPVPMPVLSSDTVRAIFLANGFRIAPGHTDLKEYVYRAADALLVELLKTIRYEDLMRVSAELVTYRHLLSYNETYLPGAGPGEVKGLVAKLERSMPQSRPSADAMSLTTERPVVLSDFGNDGKPVEVNLRWRLPEYYTPTTTAYRVTYHA